MDAISLAVGGASGRRRRACNPERGGDCGACHDCGAGAPAARRLVGDDGDATAAAIRGRLREELARRDTLTAELARLEAAPPPAVEALVRDEAARAQDARGLLGRHIPQARQVVRQLL